MKKIILFAAFAALFGIFANAQSDQDGLYINQADFENNKLSYTSTSGEKIKITFNEFLDKPFITVKQNGEKTTIFKDDIFAYQHNGNVVRTWNFVSYSFLEKGPVWIYYRNEYISNKGKGLRREKNYYYSVTGSGEILPLTIRNLKKSFPDRHMFHNFLDAQFQRDADLSFYDSYEKKFRINHILETTK